MHILHITYVWHKYYWELRWNVRSVNTVGKMLSDISFRFQIQSKSTLSIFSVWIKQDIHWALGWCHLLTTFVNFWPRTKLWKQISLGKLWASRVKRLVAFPFYLLSMFKSCRNLFAFHFSQRRWTKSQLSTGIVVVDSPLPRILLALVTILHNLTSNIASAECVVTLPGFIKKMTILFSHRLNQVCPYSQILFQFSQNNLCPFSYETFGIPLMLVLI